MKFCTVILLLSVSGLALSQANYCAIRTCAAHTHSSCGRSLWSFGARCSQADRARSRLPTAQEQAYIVQLHNEMRRRVAIGVETRGRPGPQPPASNMRQMIWDPEIAAIAQIHAQQCVFNHDLCRNTAKYAVGQNLYIRMSSAPFTNLDWASAIRSWYDEVSNFSPSLVRSLRLPSGPAIGHYTQLVWANTYAVGCGVTTFIDRSSSPSFPYRQLYVCNYGPAGNYVGTPIYRVGQAGSACPRGTRNSNGLCA